jgi:hypothetical protein
LQAVKNDPDKRTLTVVKANHGRVGEQIAIRWDDGIFDLDAGGDSVAADLINKKADDIFLTVFLKLIQQGQRLGPNQGPSYAAKKVSEQPEAKGFNSKTMAGAMQRLLNAGVLRIETTGAPSRRYDQLLPASN